MVISISFVCFDCQEVIASSLLSIDSYQVVLGKISSYVLTQFQSLRLPWCLWPIVGCQRRYKDREQTRYPRCREAEGAPDGLGEAIHCWTSPERWAYGRTRSLRFFLSHRCTCTTLAVFVLCYFALLKLHVWLLTNLCILKFPVPCDYGLYWSIVCAVDVKSMCFRCFSPLTHLCIVHCTLLLPGIFCTQLVVLLEFRASKGSFCAYTTSMSLFCFLFEKLLPESFQLAHL